MPHLYNALGLAPDVDCAEVKRAFRALAKQYHPDRKGGDAARFHEISQAYAILADPARRAVYDDRCALERASARRRLAGVMATMTASFTLTVSSGMAVAGWLLGT